MNAVSAGSGPSTSIPRASDDTRFRQSSWFLASVSYDALKWLNLSLAYYVVRPILDPDGSYGNPFYRAGDARVSFSLTFGIDQIIEAAAQARAKHRTASTAAANRG